MEISLKKEIFLEPIEDENLSRKALVVTKKIFEKGSGLLNWEDDIVNDWCFLSKYGLEPVVNTHTILFQIYKKFICEHIFRFPITEKRVKVLMIGSAISPYFVQCSDYLYHKENEIVYAIQAYDPLNDIVERNIREYEAEKCNRVEWEITSEKIDGKYTWNGKNGQKLTLINGCFKGKEDLNIKQDIVILPTCIYNKENAGEFFLFIIKLLECLVEKGVFIMQVDIIDKRSEKLNWLCASLLKIGLKEILHPIVLEGERDSCFKRKKIYSIANAIPTDLYMGGNQVIFFLEKQGGLNFDQIDDGLNMFSRFMQEYY